MAVRVPESGDDYPGTGVDEEDFVFGEVEAEKVDFGAASDTVDPVVGADHPVEVPKTLLLLLGIGRPWRAGDDASVVHDEHSHFEL